MGERPVLTRVFRRNQLLTLQRWMLRCSSKTMTKEQIFSIWAPDDSLWSRWAKPVLFAYMDAVLPAVSVAESASDLSWCAAANDRVALVLDLPGAEGVL